MLPEDPKGAISSAACLSLTDLTFIPFNAEASKRKPHLAAILVIFRMNSPPSLLTLMVLEAVKAIPLSFSSDVDEIRYFHLGNSPS